MNDALKMAITSFAKAAVDRGVVAVGVFLVSHGVLAPALVPGFDQVAAGLVMIVLGAAVGWYRDHGKALVTAEVDRLNAQVDALTKQIEQGRKVDGRVLAEAIAQVVAKNQTNLDGNAIAKSLAANTK